LPTPDPDPLAVEGSIVLESSGAQFPTIAAAVEAARDGDRIELGAGTYTESLQIDKSITLAGTTGTILNGEGLRRPLHVRDATVRLENLVFQDGLGEPGCAVLVERGELVVERCEFRDCRSSGCAGAIAARASALLRVTDSLFLGNISDGRGGACHVAAGSGFTTLNATFEPDSCAVLRAFGNSPADLTAGSTDRIADTVELDVRSLLVAIDPVFGRSYRLGFPSPAVDIGGLSLVPLDLVVDLDVDLAVDLAVDLDGAPRREFEVHRRMRARTGESKLPAS